MPRSRSKGIILLSSNEISKSIAELSDDIFGALTFALSSIFQHAYVVLRKAYASGEQSAIGGNKT